VTTTGCTTGCTHVYGPIGAALGSFAGFLDRPVLATIAGALRDSASQEWCRMMGAASDEERVYHRARWLDQTAGADYAARMSGEEV